MSPNVVLLLRALWGRCRVPGPIRTIVINQIHLSDILICPLLGRVQCPIFSSVPPVVRRITWLDVWVLNWAAINVKSLEMSLKWCMAPISLCLATVCCPAISIPQACLNLHWLWRVADSSIRVVLEHSYGSIIHVKSNIFTYINRIYYYKYIWNRIYELYRELSLTQSDTGSTRFCTSESQQLGQTKDTSFALYSLDHLQTHLSVMWSASLLCCPRTRNRAHRDYYCGKLADIETTTTINYILLILASLTWSSLL